jgi:hypothetical protein
MTVSGKSDVDTGQSGLFIHGSLLVTEWYNVGNNLVRRHALLHMVPTIRRVPSNRIFLLCGTREGGTQTRGGDHNVPWLKSPLPCAWTIGGTSFRNARRVVTHTCPVNCATSHTVKQGCPHDKSEDNKPRYHLIDSISPIQRTNDFYVPGTFPSLLAKLSSIESPATSSRLSYTLDARSISANLGPDRRSSSRSIRPSASRRRP